MERVTLEIIKAIKEIKDILADHNREINQLKSQPKQENSVDEELIKMALESSRKSYFSSSGLEKKVGELEIAVKELTEKIEIGEPEVSEVPLEKLRRAIAE